MIKFKGQVLTVSDEVQAFHDKDKDGNKLPTTKDHRITLITLLVKDGTKSVPLVCKGFDLPATFQMPKEGDTWETPDIVEFKSKFRAVPECALN